MPRLIVAEKPKVGRAIAHALALRGRAETGFLDGGDTIVTWCIGHLVTLADPEDYDPAWKPWRLDRLPILPEKFDLKVERGSGGGAKQFGIVSRLARRADVREIVNACDAGREGELIFDLVMRLAGVDKRVLRLWTASLTDEAIRAAYAAMKPGSAYVGLRDAARSRQEADWLVGMNATRAMTLAARGPGRREGKPDVYSVGRVQTPTLALIVARDREIREFVPKDYWTVVARFDGYDGTWFLAPRTKDDKEKERFDTLDEAAALVARLAGKPAHVASVVEKDVRIPPELLYDLTTLQREANRRFGFTAQKTLSLAQALYEEHKVLSYPRTSSRHLTQDVAATVPGILQQLRGGPYDGVIARITASGARLGRRFVDDAKVEDHHALLPTGKTSSRLSPDEQRVFDLVVRRILGAHLPDRVEARSTIITVIRGEALVARDEGRNAPASITGETFRTTGKVVRQLGWSEIDGRPAAKDEPKPIPAVTRGQSVAVKALAPKAGRTTPPRPYTEADVLGVMETAGKLVDDEELRAAMKDAGLGTPATRAAILEGLISRRYVERRGKILEPTEKGRGLIAVMPTPALTSPALTGTWEARLAAMGRGAYARDAFMAEIRTFTTDAVRAIAGQSAGARAGASTSAPLIARRDDRPPAPPPGTCSACGKPPRVVFSTKRGTWYRRCDACDKWC